VIYFMQPTDGGPVKIGCSVDVERRHDQLEWHYGKPLALLATLPGDRETEREIHGRFAHLRIGRTEQFRPAADLMEFIGRPLLVDPNPEAVEGIEPAGPPPIDIRIRVDAKLQKQLQAAAEKEFTTVAAFVRGAIVRELKRREAEAK
jgi:hypothetical protein